MALASFGAPFEGLTEADFADVNKFFRMGREPVMIDILPKIDGIEFDSAWKNRVSAIIDQQSGQEAFSISSQSLITAKRTAGRLQDIADVAAILKAEESRL